MSVGASEMSVRGNTLLYHLNGGSVLLLTFISFFLFSPPDPQDRLTVVTTCPHYVRLWPRVIIFCPKCGPYVGRLIPQNIACVKTPKNQKKICAILDNFARRKYLSPSTIVTKYRKSEKSVATWKLRTIIRSSYRRCIYRAYLNLVNSGPQTVTNDRRFKPAKINFFGRSCRSCHGDPATSLKISQALGNA